MPEVRKAHGALWMPMGVSGRALATDFPVANRPYTFAMPTIWSWGSRPDLDNARAEGETLLTATSANSTTDPPPDQQFSPEEWGWRIFEDAPVWVGPGLHLTNPPTLALHLLKGFTGTSYSLED